MATSTPKLIISYHAPRFARRRRQVKSKTVHGTVDPHWNEEMMLCWDGMAPLTLDVFSSDEHMGSVAVPLDFLLDEESFFCILPEEFKDHHLTMLEENENMENITEEEITKAKKVLEKAKEQKKEVELESFKI